MTPASPHSAVLTSTMAVLYILVPLALLLAGAAVAAFRWAVRDGQFDDTETPALRILLDDVAPDDIGITPRADSARRVSTPSSDPSVSPKPTHTPR